LRSEQQVISRLLEDRDYGVAVIRAARLSDTGRIDCRDRVRLARQSLLIQDDPIDPWVVYRIFDAISSTACTPVTFTTMIEKRIEESLWK
jgi:hypothetical protein